MTQTRSILYDWRRGRHGPAAADSSRGLLGATARDIILETDLAIGTWQFPRTEGIAGTVEACLP